MTQKTTFALTGRDSDLFVSPHQRRWFRTATQLEVNQYITAESGNPALPTHWDAEVFYDVGDKVVGSDAEIYTSNSVLNQGNDPTSSGTWDMDDPDDSVVKAGMQLLKRGSCGDPPVDIDEYSRSIWAFPEGIDECTQEPFVMFKPFLIYFPTGNSAGIGQRLSAFMNPQTGEWENTDPVQGGCVQWARAVGDWYRGATGACSWTVADLLDGCNGNPTGVTVAAKIPVEFNKTPNVWFGREFVVQCDNDMQEPPDNLCGQYTQGQQQLGYTALGVQDEPLGAVKMMARNGWGGPGWGSMGGGGNACDQGGTSIRMTEPNDGPQNNGPAQDAVYIAQGSPTTPQFGRTIMCLNNDELQHDHGLDLVENKPLQFTDCGNIYQFMVDVEIALAALSEPLENPVLDPSEYWSFENAFGLSACKTNERSQKQLSSPPGSTFDNSPCLKVGVNKDNYSDLNMGNPYTDETDEYWCQESLQQNCNATSPDIGNCVFQSGGPDPPTGPTGREPCDLLSQGISIQPRTQLFDMWERIDNSCNFVASTGNTTNWQIPTMPDQDAPNGVTLAVMNNQRFTLTVNVGPTVIITNPQYDFQISPITAGFFEDPSPPGQNVERFVADGTFVGPATITVTITGDNGCQITHVVNLDIG